MSRFWAEYGSVFDFAGANAFLALSTWIAMSTGIFSLAGAAFGALGGYLSIHLVTELGWSLYPAVTAAVVFGTASGWVFGRLLLRLESHWLAMATIALVLMVRVVSLNLTSVTGGSAGIGVPRELSTTAWLVLLALCAFVVERLRRSTFGSRCAAVREDPQVAAALGIDVQATRRTALALSGAVGALGGVVLAQMLQYVSPDTYDIHLAFAMVAAAVLGGLMHWSGAIVGAALFVGLPEAVRSYTGDLNEVVTGVALVLIMIFLPDGVIGLFRRGRGVAEASYVTDVDEAPPPSGSRPVAVPSDEGGR